MATVLAGAMELGLGFDVLGSRTPLHTFHDL